VVNIQGNQKQDGEAEDVQLRVDQILNTITFFAAKIKDGLIIYDTICFLQNARSSVKILPKGFMAADSKDEAIRQSASR